MTTSSRKTVVTFDFLKKIIVLKDSSFSIAFVLLRQKTRLIVAVFSFSISLDFVSLASISFVFTSFAFVSFDVVSLVVFVVFVSISRIQTSTNDRFVQNKQRFDWSRQQLTWRNEHRLACDDLSFDRWFLQRRKIHRCVDLNSLNSIFVFVFVCFCWKCLFLLRCVVLWFVYFVRITCIIKNNSQYHYFCFLNRSRFFSFKDWRVCSSVKNFLLDFVLNLFVFRRFAILSNLRSSRSFSNLTIASFAFSKCFIDFHEFSYDDESTYAIKYWNSFFLIRLSNICDIFHFFSFFTNIVCDSEFASSRLYQDSNKETWNTKCLNLYCSNKSSS